MKKQTLLSVHIPMKLVRKNGRKRIILPENATLPTRAPEQNGHLIHVILRAHKWQKSISEGKYAKAEDLAAHLGIANTYVCRVLRLNLLAPDIRQAILDGKQPKGLRVIDILQPFPLLWKDQRFHLGFLQP